MFKRVIVGVDGREGGRDATLLAEKLCGEHGVLTLANVYPLEPRVWGGTMPGYDAEQRQKAEELLAKGRGEAGVEAQLRVVGSSSAGRGLHELAEETDADLIVVGSSRRGLLGRVLIGDDTRAALNGAPCAIAVAPAGYGQRSAELREIGVGYDGSPESKDALGVARQLAGERRARLSAFEAVSIPAYARPGWGALTTIPELVDRARERIARIEDVTPHAAYGQAAEELAVYSASLDLLVIGSRGYGPMGRLVHGSTALGLARTARCPLLVLPRAAQQAANNDGPGQAHQVARATTSAG